MAIYVTGSLAYDRVMTFPGSFSDYILPDKIHMLNVSFAVDHMDEKRGGTGGNIAYNLALLGETSRILASAGRDFGSYREFLESSGMPVDGINVLPGEFTAGAYITADKNSNQITGFHAAAMSVPCAYGFPDLDPANDIAIIAPTCPDDMEGHARLYAERGVRFIFDPGQQIPRLTPEQLVTGITGAYALVSNDYELEMICKLTGLGLEQILERTPVVITTLGGKGSRISWRGGRHADIGVARINDLKDPTGAGDSYRAGLIKGILHGMSLEDAAALGAVCASFCVEKFGTQEHYYDEAAVNQRLGEAFGLKLPVSFKSLIKNGA